MNYYIVLLTLLLLSSCAQSGLSSDKGGQAQASYMDTKQFADARIEAETMATIETETYKKLQGLWVNTSDTTNYILINNNKKSDFYENRFYTPENYYVLGDQCHGLDNPIKPEDKERYLSILNEMRQCYYIEKLTDSVLELQYLGSNISVKYVRRGSGGC